MIMSGPSPDSRRGPARSTADSGFTNNRLSGQWLSFFKFALVAGLSGCILAMHQGLLTLHMAGHILTMNLLAPACAWLLYEHRASARSDSKGRGLLLATAVQLFVFLLWHSPAAMTLAMHSETAHIAMLGGLLVASAWFWTCVFAAVRQDRMAAIGALLLTGKIVCLFAVVLVFAPRLIYADMSSHHHGGAMRDQQLAGLLMLAACPLTYVGASISIFARWLARQSATPEADGSRE